IQASKTALRQDITALRVIPPKGPTGSTKNNKRAGTQHDTRPVDPKRQKHTDLGGLQPTWKSILNATKARSTSTTSSTIASQSDIQFDEVENGGELGKDESVEQLKVQRDGKSHDTSPKVFVAVKLESVDADGIAQEERETGKPARPPKPRVKRADIPFVSASDHDVWKSKIQPGIIVWAGTRAKQFQVNADPEFRTITRQLWNTHLGTLAHMPLNYTDMNGRSSLRCDHPAILAYAQQQIRNYRSKFASAALSIVVSHMEQYSDSTEDRKQLVDELLHHDAFIYENRCESTGAFRGKLIMQTFAFHLTWALSAPPSTTEKEEHPGGALALAVKRALKLCTPGYNTLSQKSSGRNTPRNNPDSFDEKCAADLSLFYQTIMDLKDSKWELIYAASEKHILHCPHLGAGPALKDARKNLNMQGVGAVEDVDGASSDGVSLDNLIVLSDPSEASDYTASIAIGGGQTGTANGTPSQVKVNFRYLLAPSVSEKTVALIGPEFIIIWAVNQLRSTLYGLKKLRAFDACKHWTVAHGMFLVMGGFVLADESGARLEVLQAHKLNKLLSDHLITLPHIPESEIMDRSKGDALAKALVLIQTTWFTTQVISRAVLHLPITELELTTVAFALLNFLTYALWWKKPLDVRHPIVITLRCSPQQAAALDLVPILSASSTDILSSYDIPSTAMLSEVNFADSGYSADNRSSWTASSGTLGEIEPSSENLTLPLHGPHSLWARHV
ncbi:hypothetical protein D9757_013519, partial [Collybiopsis confluens]